MHTILIVDDEAENRDSLKMALADQNPDWNILCAASTENAIEILTENSTTDHAVEVMLTDLVMDREDSGMLLLEQARKIDPLLMMILFTAKEKSLDRYSAFDYGAFDVVEKNLRGTSAVRELNIKTRAAIQYRSWYEKISFIRRYFDPRVYETILNDPSVLALQDRLVTIAFWDIRGFSALCEILKAHPALISRFLKEYGELAARTIFKHNGLLDKFIGDGVMALFGVLNHKNDNGAEDALAAVRCAIDFNNGFSALLEKWMPEWKLYTPQKIAIGLGCGIHTGNALVGNVGTDYRDQFTALGAHVNFASRIEARSSGGQILLSQSTQIRLSDTVPAAKVDEFDDVKNIPGTFEVFEVSA